MGYNIRLMGLSFLISVLLVAIANQAYSETDWKGEPKWKPEAHDDNNPSEEEFWKVAEEKKLHSLAKCIDHMECKENNIDFEDFKETTSWTNSTEEQKFCIVESEDLGNTLVDYEVLDCYKNPDYYQERG